MHDLKFDKLFPIPFSAVPKQEVYKSPACNKVGDSYLHNMRLTTSLAMVPGYSFMNGENWGYAVIRAQDELQIENPDHPDVQARASKIWDALDVEGFDASSITHFYESTVNAARMVTLPGRTLSHGALHALLQAIVIQAWTALELFAEDLHTSVREQHSICFPKNVLSKKYRFRRLQTLFEAYENLFDGDRAIKAALINCDVKALGLMRHLLVHQSGRVDQKYLDQCAETPVVPITTSLTVGSLVLLDGGMIRSLVDPVTMRAFELLKLVDAWVDVHNRRTP